MSEGSKHERDFLVLVKVASALGLGVMAAFLYSLKSVHPELKFEFGFGVIVAFVLASLFGWLGCGVIAWRRAETDRRYVTRWLWFFGGITLLATAATFARALRGFAWAELRDVIEGTLMAVALLSVVAVMIWKVFRFFEIASELPDAKAREAEADLDADDEP